MGDWNGSLPFLKGRREQHFENTGTNFKHFLQNHGQICTKYPWLNGIQIVQMQQRAIYKVCLEFIVPLERIFHSYGDVTIAGEGLQILTYAWRSWPLSSEGYTYCDKSLPFIMVIPEDPWHSVCWRAFGSGAVDYTCLYDLGLQRPGIDINLKKINKYRLHHNHSWLG